MCRSKAEVACHLILKVLNIRREKFDHFSAFGTDHMVVMFVIVMMFVVSLIVAKSDLASQSGLGQQFEGSINSREPNAGIELVYERIQVLACKMLFGSEKRLKDQIPLSCTSQPGILNMLEKQLLLGFEFYFISGQLRSILPFQLCFRHGHSGPQLVDTLRINAFFRRKFERSFAKKKVNL